ncbi:MAG TPA: adenylate/guanylate cyclase domain-containing protein [Planctomicrobium sp.]|nr:adenylate/guanylate cyclase domain-containing protein [Planctomicrobium sp.]
MGTQISVVVENQLAFVTTFTETLELGRQQPGEPEPFQLVSPPDGPRLIVAAAGETGVSRRQMLVRELPNDRIEVLNLSASAPLQLMARPALGPGQQTTMELPCAVSVGTGLLFNFNSAEEQTTPLNELPEATILPGRAFGKAREELRSPAFRSGKDPEPLVRGLQVVMDLFLSARCDTELFASAIDGAFALIRFDTVRVLQLENGHWREAQSRSASGATSELPPPSRQVLESVRDRKRTFWESGISGSPSVSLSQVTGVIGAPILDAQGDVIGILYGDRNRDLSATDDEISALDARLMELLACGIASGLARLQHQERAEQMRLQFAQFFTSELAAELEQNPGLLEGQDADVSLLFCDIRGFSRISERIGATETFHWIHDVMDTLSDCVLNHQGVLVDYIGDELMAMWGAPRSQADHAEGACRAALAMLETLPELNARWQSRLGEPVDLAIGINSGRVKVGNAGSRRKFKYSPLGNAVNLASRVVGVTRHLKTSLLVTGHTIQQLPESFLNRKLCDVQVVNMDEPVGLFELLTDSVSQQLAQDYEHSRQAFEQREFRSAAHLTARLLETFPNDGPSLVLLSRAVQAMVDGPDANHPVWRLSEK